MIYTASVTIEGRVEILEGLEYKNIRECKNELRANGYKVRFVCKPEQFDEVCEKMHEKRELKSNINKAKYAYYKKEAEKYSTSVKTYRAAMKTCLEKDKNGEYVNNYMTLEDWIEFYDEHKDYR